jgi:MSHA pilin protein MshC
LAAFLFQPSVRLGNLSFSGYMSETLTTSKCRNPNGFTIVEIVIVLVIVSILAATVFSRFLDTSTFNSLIVRDQIISMARVAQQASLGRADVSLTITPAGSDSVTLDVSDVSGSIQSVVLELEGVSLSGDINKLAGNQTPSCESDNGDNAIAAATPMTINFDELGDLALSGVTGATGAITSALRICLNNVNTYSVCVSPAGFAYSGSCDVDP